MSHSTHSILILLAVAFAGCAADGARSPVTDDATHDAGPRRVVVYDLNATASASLMAGFATPADSSGIVAAGFEAAVSEDSDAAADSLQIPPRFTRLRIEDAGSGIARVTVSLYDRPPTGDRTLRVPKRLPSAASRRPAGRPHDGTFAAAAAPIRERELRLPAAELDLILADLRQTGLFTSDDRPGGGARIEIRATDGTTGKDWTPEPRLDALVERTLCEGQPIDPHGTARLTVRE